MIWADLLLELALHLGPHRFRKNRNVESHPGIPAMNQSRVSSAPELTSSQNFRM